MGKAMELVSTFRTAAGADAAPVATVVVAGDVIPVRAFNPPNKARLVTVWGTAATEAIARLRSPNYHDNVQGLRFRLPTGIQPRGLLTEWETQDQYTTDAPVAEVQAGAAETDGFAWINYYDDLPGADARLATIDEITARVKNLFTVEVTCAAGVAIGNYSAPVAINSSFDQFKANTDYALLGYECDITGLSVKIVGSDLGNYGVGGPMTTERMETRDWFVQLNKKLGQPTIPIINSQNKAATMVSNAQVVVGLASDITLIMAQLSA